MEINLVEARNQIDLQLKDKEIFNTLVQTTFKGLAEHNVKKAILEGVLRGFTFKDFLEKNIYAIPFSDKYSLVTSVDYARKIGMRSGVVGKDAPNYEISPDGKIISCSITVKKKIGDYVGDFSAEVYFDEYYRPGRTYQGKYTPGLWDTKPKTMIAKVAEMHALRMACPEELSQSYIEEELHKEIKEKPEVNFSEHEQKISTAKTIEELKTVWSALPAEAKKNLAEIKDKVKANLEGVK